MPATEDYDADPQDIVDCYVCGTEWDANSEDRPCECCYDCDCSECECICQDCLEDPCECGSSQAYLHPLRRRNYAHMPDGCTRDSLKELQNFGVEIEVSDLGRHHIMRANRVFKQLPIKDVRVRNDFIRIVDDGSIRGDDKGELITAPVTFDDHYNFLLACTMGSEEARSFDWRAVRHKTQRYKFKLLHSMLDSRVEYGSSCDDFNAFSTWLPGAHSWYNESCGMHITTCHMAATPLTWLKLCYFLNNCTGEDYNSLGGRYSSTYLQQRPLGMRHLAHAFRGDARGFTQKYSPLNYKVQQGLMEFRLFRSATNPIRILSNMQMTQVWLAYFSQCPMRTALHVTSSHIGAYLAKHKHVYPFAAWAMTQSVHDRVAQGFRAVNVTPLPFTP